MVKKRKEKEIELILYRSFKRLVRDRTSPYLGTIHFFAILGHGIAL